MKNKKFFSLITIGAIALAVVFGGAFHASADSDKAKGEQGKIENAREKGQKEINHRIEELNKVIRKVNEMKKLPGGVKGSIASSTQALINSLNALKAKISSSTDYAIIKADVKGITNNYRVYELVVPQGHIITAAAKINTAADKLSVLAGKYDLKIVVAKSQSKDTNSVSSKLSSMNAKIAEAKLLASQASTTVSALVPDFGDKTKFEANKSALKAAAQKLKTAEKDLKDASKLGKDIKKALNKMNIGTGATTTPPVSTTTPPVATTTATTTQ